MLSRLNSLVDNPLSWLLLAASAFALELCALFFQYGMGLEPCIMCIYQRVAIIGLVVAGLSGYFAKQWTIIKFEAFAIWGVSAIWGLLIAIEHVDIQTNADSLFYTCDLVPNFPSWLPLHEWIPSLFEATGDCGEIAWSFLGYSMPEWMIVVYGVYTALFVVFASVFITNMVKKLIK